MFSSENTQSSILDKNSGLFNKFTRGLKYVVIQTWGHRFVGLIVFIVLARLLTPENIGLVAMSMVYIALLQVFLEQGFVEAIVQSPSTSRELLDTAFWTNFALAFILCIGSIAVAPIVGVLFKEPNLPSIICGLAPLFVMRGSVSVHLALLRREMAFRRLAIAAVSGVFVGGSIGIALAFAGFGVWALVIYQLVSRFVEAIALWMQNPWRPGKRIKANEFRSLFRFGANVTGSQLVNFLNKYGADLVIGLFLGPIAVGYYNFSFRLSRTLVEMIGSVVSLVSFPFFSRLQDDPQTGMHAYSRITEQISIISFPLFIGMAVCAPQIVHVMFGEKWLPAVPVIRALSVIGLLHSLYYVNSAVFLGYGKPQWRLGLDILNAATNTLVFVFAAQWNVLAVAWAYVIRGYIFSPIPLLGIKKLLRMTFLAYIQNISHPLIAAGLMGTFLSVVSPFLVNTTSPLFLLIGQVALGAMIYLGTLFLIVPPLPQRTWRYLISSVKSSKGTII
jgi:PST family polysaccharide transporter